MYSKLGLLNTHIGLALIVSVLDLPMTIWFLTAVFKGIPVSFEESAKLDGANMFQMFFYIILPLLKASIFSISILVFIGAWNRFLLSQVLNQYEQYRTVVVGLTLYQTTHTLSLIHIYQPQKPPTFPLLPIHHKSQLFCCFYNIITPHKLRPHVQNRVWPSLFLI